MSSKILKLKIRNFRGVQELEWRPSVGMNFIIGGGDTGKTTVLEAVDLLFSPSTSFNVSETDYWMRDTATSFSIEAVVRLDEKIDINTQCSDPQRSLRAARYRTAQQGREGLFTACMEWRAQQDA